MNLLQSQIEEYSSLLGLKSLPNEWSTIAEQSLKQELSYGDFLLTWLFLFNENFRLWYVRH